MKIFMYFGICYFRGVVVIAHTLLARRNSTSLIDQKPGTWKCSSHCMIVLTLTDLDISTCSVINSTLRACVEQSVPSLLA